MDAEQTLSFRVLSLADAIIAEYRPKLMDAGKHVGERVITSDAPVKPMSLYQLRNINPGLAEQVDRGEHKAKAAGFDAPPPPFSPELR